MGDDSVLVTFSVEVNTLDTNFPVLGTRVHSRPDGHATDGTDSVIVSLDPDTSVAVRGMRLVVPPSWLEGGVPARVKLGGAGGLTTRVTHASLIIWPAVTVLLPIMAIAKVPAGVVPPIPAAPPATVIVTVGVGEHEPALGVHEVGVNEAVEPVGSPRARNTMPVAVPVAPVIGMLTGLVLFVPDTVRITVAVVPPPPRL